MRVGHLEREAASHNEGKTLRHSLDEHPISFGLSGARPDEVREGSVT
jgi:hypothetical protein